MKHDNRSFARCFYLEFWHEKVKPNVRRVLCTRLTVGKEVCRSFARHRNYRLVLSLRSRYRQKTKNRLPPKIYRRRSMALPQKNYRHTLVYRLRQNRYRQKTKNPTAENVSPSGITTPPPVSALKSVTDDNPKNSALIMIKLTTSTRVQVTS